MSKFDAPYRLPALIFFAALVATSSGAAPPQENPGSNTPAQPAATAPAPPLPAPIQSDSTTPAPTTGTAPAANSPLTYVASAPPPTPEQIGDSLSVRQRYQAAIAAYSKADPMTAPIWNKMGIA